MLLAMAEAAHGADAATARRSRRWCAAPRPTALRRGRHGTTRAARARCAELARHRPAAGRRTRDRRHPARARRPLHPPGAGRRPAAHAGDPADRPQPARLRSVPHPQRLRGAGRRAAGAAAARPPRRRRQRAARNRSRSCCGAPTTSRPRAGRSRQALALMGARAALRQLRPPRRRRADPARAELGRPRIDVVITLSGIFRDLLPLQIKLLAEAAFLAASGRRAARAELRAQARAGLPGASTAATSRPRRCASSATPTAPTAPTSTTWSRTAAGTTRTNSPRPTRAARASPTAATAAPVQQTAAAAERAGRRRARLPEPRLGRTRRHHGRQLLRHAGRHQPRGAARQGRRRRRRSTSATRRAASGTVRTLAEQVALETRTRMLNPKWYEGMLKHGYEGVRQIEAHVTNTMGWSATTGQVAALGLPAADRDLRARPRRCASAWRELNPTASAKVANRLIEATSATTGQPDAADARSPAPRRRRTRRPPRRRLRRSCRMMDTTTVPLAIAARRTPARRPDGEGSVQVQLDPNAQDRHRQGVRGLRQGRHRQEHDLVEPVGRLLQARQARAADRLRSQARLDLHADQEADADRDRRAGDRWTSTPRSCAPRTSSSRATTA